LTTLEDVREGFGHDLLLAGVLACRFDGRTKLSRMVLEELRRALPGKVFDTVIRENVRMRECPASGESIFSFAPDCNAAKDYRTLAQEMIAEPEKWLSATGDGSDIFAGMSVESLRDNAAARVRDDSAARNVRKAALEGSAEEDAELSRADTIDLSVEEAQIPDLPWAPWQMPPAGETESKTTRSATPPPLPNEIGERPPAFEMPPAGEPQPAPAPETTASTPERAGDEPPLPNASETEDVPYDSPAPAESPQPVRPARSPDGSAYDEATQSLETWLESLRAAKHRLEHKADDVDEQPPAENAPIHDEPAGLDELGTFDGETDPAETNDRDAAPAEPDEQHAHTVPSWAHWMTHAPDELEPHEDQRAAQPDVAEEPAPEEPDASPADELPSVEAEPYDEPMASEPDAGDEPPPRAEATNVPEAAPDDRGDVASPESRQPETATSPPAPAEGASRDEGDERGMVLMPSLPPKHSAQAAGAAQETPAATAPGPAAPEDDAHKHNHGADESSGDPERFPALKSLLERIKSGDAGAEGNSKK
jgi:hypothetical protein